MELTKEEIEFITKLNEEDIKIDEEVVSTNSTWKT